MPAPSPAPPSAVKGEAPAYSSLDLMDTVEIPADYNRCLISSGQSLSKGVHIPVQPHPTDPIAGIHNHRVCLAQGKSDEPDAVHPSAQRPPKVACGVSIVESSAKVISVDAASRMIRHASEPTCPFPRRMSIDQASASLHPDSCRFTAHRTSHSAFGIEYNDIEHNISWRTSSCLVPSAPTSFLSDTHDSQDDSDCLSEGSSESDSSVPSPGADCAEKAYLRLSAIYGFDPLPPPPPFSPKATTSAQEQLPRFEGGIIMAARRIQAALCIDKHVKSSWGIPIPTDSEDDNKPIPGWTDGSNAWRPSVYGFAPPRDFTRSDPDDAAIRAYGSYVASPHRSRGVHSTIGKGSPAAEVHATTSSFLSSNAEDVSTQELYRQYCESTAWRCRSRTSIHIRGAGFSTSPNGSARHRPREVPLLKRGAEGRLLVPDVKMRRPASSFPGMDDNSRISDSPVAGGPSQNSETGPNNKRTQSYKSETHTYSIMRLTPKKEKRVERRIVDGLERDVHVEVLIEEPIKRLFLFGGARD